jgi:hypothetical protein
MSDWNGVTYKPKPFEVLNLKGLLASEADFTSCYLSSFFVEGTHSRRGPITIYSIFSN